MGVSVTVDGPGPVAPTPGFQASIAPFSEAKMNSAEPEWPAAPWMKNIIQTYGGNPYQHLVDAAKMAQKDGVIKGILLHQGESNNNDTQWPNKVKGIYEGLLKDLNLKAEAVPLLAGGLVPADQKGACASMNKIIAELPHAKGNSAASTIGLIDEITSSIEFGTPGLQQRADGALPMPLLPPVITAILPSSFLFAVFICAP